MMDDYDYREENACGPMAGWQKMQQVFDTILQRKTPELGTWNRTLINELSSDLNSLDGFVRDGSRLDYAHHVDPSDKWFSYDPKDFSDDYTNCVYENLALRISTLYCDAHGYDRNFTDYGADCDPFDITERLQRGSNLYIKKVAEDGRSLAGRAADQKGRTEAMWKSYAKQCDLSESQLSDLLRLQSGADGLSYQFQEDVPTELEQLGDYTGDTFSRIPINARSSSVKPIDKPVQEVYPLPPGMVDMLSDPYDNTDSFDF